MTSVVERAASELDMLSPSAEGVAQLVLLRLPHRLLHLRGIVRQSRRADVVVHARAAHLVLLEQRARFALVPAL